MHCKDGMPSSEGHQDGAEGGGKDGRLIRQQRKFPYEERLSTAKCVDFLSLSILLQGNSIIRTKLAPQTRFLVRENPLYSQMLDICCLKEPKMLSIFHIKLHIIL